MMSTAELEAVSGGDAPPMPIPGMSYDPITENYEFGMDFQSTSYTVDAWGGETEVAPGVFDTNGDGYGDVIVVTPGEIQSVEINGQKSYASFNFEAGTFVEYAVGETNLFGFPTSFYPVGVGTFYAERAEAWSINLGFISIPVTDINYILKRN